MGRATPTDTERRIAGTSSGEAPNAPFTAGGQTTPWINFAPGEMNFVLFGTFVATVVVEESYDGGTTAVAVTDLDGNPASYSTPGAWRGRQLESDVLRRMRCASFTSGIVGWRLSQ